MSRDGKIDVCLYQSAGHGDDLEANLAELVRAVEIAAGEADLMVFPECFLTGYFTPDPVAPVARRVTPELLRLLSDLCVRTGVALIVGSYESDGAQVHNSAFAITPDGGHIGTYRKRMLFGDWEKAVFAAGTAPLVFELRGVQVGVLICYDIEFPERARELALAGADLIAVPTALMAPFDTVPRITVPARAIENHCYVAYANRIGADAAHTYLGQSCIVDPLGQSLAALGSEPGRACAAIDLAERVGARAAFDYLADLKV